MKNTTKPVNIERSLQREGYPIPLNSAITVAEQLGIVQYDKRSKVFYVTVDNAKYLANELRERYPIQ